MTTFSYFNSVSQYSLFIITYTLPKQITHPTEREAQAIANIHPVTNKPPIGMRAYYLCTPSLIRSYIRTYMLPAKPQKQTDLKTNVKKLNQNSKHTSNTIF
jgi:hypothetical protein